MCKIMQRTTILLTSALFLLASACTTIKTVGAGLGIIVAIPILAVGGVLAVAAGG